MKIELLPFTFKVSSAVPKSKQGELDHAHTHSSGQDSDYSQYWQSYNQYWSQMAAYNTPNYYDQASYYAA